MRKGNPHSLLGSHHAINHSRQHIFVGLTFSHIVSSNRHTLQLHKCKCEHKGGGQNILQSERKE